MTANTGYAEYTEGLEIHQDSREIAPANLRRLAPEDIPKSRPKRGIFWDFFQKMVTTKNLIVDVSDKN